VSTLQGRSNTDVRSTHAGPPASEAAIQAVERELSQRLPASLRTFFERGASDVDCSYAMEPEGQALDRVDTLLSGETRVFGGAQIGPLSDLPDFSRAVRAWAEETWVAEDPEQRQIWESAIPFVALRNGDYLALDLRGGSADPPVEYLNHDDESFMLAPGLAAFLTAWERLCYIGPEHWLLSEFIGDDGYLDSESDRAGQLRALLAG
jgi:hypothetical protein